MKRLNVLLSLVVIVVVAASLIFSVRLAYASTVNLLSLTCSTAQYSIQGASGATYTHVRTVVATGQVFTVNLGSLSGNNTFDIEFNPAPALGTQLKLEILEAG